MEQNKEYGFALPVTVFALVVVMRVESHLQPPVYRHNHKRG